MFKTCAKIFNNSDRKQGTIFDALKTKRRLHLYHHLATSKKELQQIAIKRCLFCPKQATDWQWFLFFKQKSNHVESSQSKRIYNVWWIKCAKSRKQIENHPWICV